MQYRLGLVTEQGSRDIETKSLCFSPQQAMLGMFVTHVRSNRRRVPRRRNCLTGWPSQSAGDLPNLQAVNVLLVIVHVIDFPGRTTNSTTTPMKYCIKLHLGYYALLVWVVLFCAFLWKIQIIIKDFLAHLSWKVARKELKMCRTLLHLPVLLKFNLNFY